MGFASVYRCLQDVFPQIDARILKAVAIEHPKDADAAVNDILTEVIPYMNGTSGDGAHSNSAEHGERLEDSASRNGVFPSDSTHLDKVDDAGSSSGPKCAAVENLETRVCSNSELHDDLTHLDEVVYTGSYSKQSSAVENLDMGFTHGDEALSKNEILGLYYENEGDSQLLRRRSSVSKKINAIVDDEKNSLPMSPSISGKDGLEQGEKDFDCSNGSSLQLRNESPVTSFVEPQEALLLNTMSEKDHIDVEIKASVSCDKTNGIVGDEEVSFGNGQDFDCSNDFSLQLRNESPVKNCGELQEAPLLNLTSEKGRSDGETGCVDEEFNRCSTFAQSGQISSIDFLDEIIEDAKNNKKTLFSAMESVMNMMKEVELQERAAERAKEEAAMGGVDILVRVEELKQMLAHAKEANDMHAGEVYGEKAILATEVRELQFRLLSLSDERDKSLATLDEMRRTLEERLAAAEEMKRTAEQEKLKKEESSQKALTEQEAIMERVVLESKLLEQEAELNSKLREFLVDRGSIMDILQGEISVICQDVSLLKEKFDNRVPLSMSVSSSQTTCKLASSSSSLKSISSAMAQEERESSEERESPKTPENRTPDSSSGNLRSNSGDDAIKSDDAILVEDGWDIFDKHTELDI